MASRARVRDPSAWTIRSVHVRVGVERGRKDSTATVKSVQYEVRFAGGNVGTTATKVVIETTGEHTPWLTIPVRATAAHNLIYPKRVTLTRRGSGPFEQNLRIATRRGDPPEIRKVEDPDGLLDIEVLEPDGPAVDIRLRVRESEAANVDEHAAHELRVHTDDPDEPKLELEYHLRTASAPSRTGAPGQ